MSFLNYSKLHNTKICSSCGKDLNETYQKKISDKTSELIAIPELNKLSKDILSYICEFNEHKHHKVIYLYNSNMSGHGHRNNCYVWSNQKRFCTDCFKYGIIKSLYVHEKRLPYKIWHIAYFTYQNSKIKNKDEYLKILEKCYLPSIFHLTFFRTSVPQVKDGFIFITEK